jgi:acetyl/propionyl-CoA carboxylase alpha subunit
MNTRLQVEHAITEAVVGVDIVKWMIRISAGDELTLKQEDISQRGHAIECRVYAENPDKLEFRPSIGRLSSFSLNILNRIGIRHDTGFHSGSRVSIHYDPLLAKLITQGEDREDALKKMNWALLNYTALGVETNVEFLRDIITHPKFQTGEISTHFITENISPDWVGRSKRKIPLEIVLAASLYDAMQSNNLEEAYDGEESLQPSPWQMLGNWGRDSLERSKVVVKSGIKRTTDQISKTIKPSS